MKYAHKGKRNILIWDGLDDGITKERYEFICPMCKHKNAYSLSNLNYLDNFGQELINYIEAEKIVTKGDFGYEIKSDIPAYLVSNRCEKCSRTVWLVVGMREIQPQRYNIFFKSIIFDNSDLAKKISIESKN